MGESSKFPKSWTLENQNLKLAVCLQIIKKSKFNGQIPLDKLKLNQKSYYYLQNSAFLGWLSMESQPQNPEFRNNPENFHPCIVLFLSLYLLSDFPCFFVFCWFFLKSTFSKNSFMYTISVSNSFIGPDLGPKTVCKCYQQTTIVGKELIY